MTSTTFFIIFIPILSIILLAVNLLLAPHNPYQEKDSVFECGFHSFLGQNRTQFSVSFFIFGLLFLLFDLEILLVYPYSVSSYTNDIYGLIIMIIFFILLTLGFIFELGKNALSIDSKQTSLPNNKNKSKSDIFFYLILRSSPPWSKGEGSRRSGNREASQSVQDWISGQSSQSSSRPNVDRSEADRQMEEFERGPSWETVRQNLQDFMEGQNNPNPENAAPENAAPENVAPENVGQENSNPVDEDQSMGDNESESYDSEEQRREDARIQAEIEERNDEDQERIDVHQHQLNKYADTDLQAIAAKGDRGANLTERERDKWETADQDITGESGHLNEPSSRNLREAIEFSRDTVEQNTEKINRRNQPDYVLSDSDDDMDLGIPFFVSLPIITILLHLRRLIMLHPIYRVYYCHYESFFVNKLFKETTRLERKFVTSTIGILVIIIFPIIVSILLLIYIH